jgi:flagellar hook-associated protein 1 FlgK
MSDLLSIGASGVRAYQSALTVTGENIANVGSAGYTRRSVRMTEISAGVGAVDRSAANGVLMTGIVRAGDGYAQLAVRSSGADLARSASGAQWLDRIEKAMTGNQLASRVTSFFNAATGLAAEPDSGALRTTMLNAGGSAAIAFTATGQAFDQIDADLDTAGNQATTQLNSLATSLVQINEGLGRTPPDSAAAAQLADQRDQILDQMSTLADVGVTLDALGRASVKLGGSQGTAFVEKNTVNGLAYSRNTDGSVGLSVVNGFDRLTVSLNGGELAGIVDGAQKSAASRTNLNNVARDLVDKVNTTQLAGEDQTGTTGVEMFKVGTKPTEISLNFDSGAKIAAAKGGLGKRDASNLADLQKLRTDSGWEGQLTQITTDNASALDQKNTIVAAQTAIRDGAVSALTSVTGVNMDSEAVELMRFQQAYSASSRVIQVARDTLQTILDIR